MKKCQEVGPLFRYMLRILLMESIYCYSNNDAAGMAHIERIVGELHRRFHHDD